MSADDAAGGRPRPGRADGPLVCPAVAEAEWLDPDEIGALSAYHRDEAATAATADQLLTIGCAVRWIGRPGGHPGRKGDGHPGTEVLWRGLAKLEAITEAWRRFHPINTCG